LAKNFHANLLNDYTLTRPTCSLDAVEVLINYSDSLSVVTVSTLHSAACWHAAVQH